MSKIKRSIFVQILLASFLPLLLIFSMVLVTINKIIFNISTNFARETAMNYAEQVSEKVDDKFLKVTNFLQLTAKNISDIDTSLPNDEKIAEEMMLSLIQADDDIFSVSFTFEADIFRKDTRFFKTYVKQDGKIMQAFANGSSPNERSEKSRWNNILFFSGETHFKSINYYDYGPGIGDFYIGEVSTPVKKGNTTIGIIGIDILYEDLMKFVSSYKSEYESTVLLLSRDGQILYAPNRKFVGTMLNDLPISNKENILNAMRTGDNYKVEGHSYFFNKESFIYLFPIKKNSELFVYFEMPTESLYKKANATSRVIFSTSVLGLFLLSASVFFATRNIVKPIKKITRNANKIANGNLDVEFEDIDEKQKSNNEIYSLQIALKKMLEQLNQTHQLKLMAIEAKFEQEKTEAESNAKTQFLAKMSHEIRTPMNAIMGMSQMLLTENLSPKQQGYVRDIKVSSDALLIIINDILDLSKLKTGNLQLVPVNYKFSPFMKNVLSIASFMSKEKGLAFSFTSNGTMPNVLFGDDVRLRQILINVLSNAIKFTKEGCVKLHLENKDGSLIFSITDTGVGIKKEDLPNLFEPFRQLDERKNRTIKGTGLGLSITKNIIDLMGGSITVNSEYDKGSTFAIEIPIVNGNCETIAQEQPDGNTFKAPTAKILVVDDNEINLHVASAILEFFDINCDTALSGTEALELVQKNQYDLVFLDHMMPEMDGVETTAHIRALGEKYMELPIIALTANAISGAKEFLISSGMSDFISKPIDKDHLQKILIKWLPLDKQESAGETAYEATHKEQSIQDINPKISNFMLLISHITQLDALAGLQNFTLQQDAYQSALLKVSIQITLFNKNIQQLHRTKNKNAFITALEEMRSSLAKIGATKLMQQSARLLEAFPKIKVSDLTAFTDELAQLSYQLAELLHNSEIVESQYDQTRNYLKKGIYKLSSFLSDKDYEMSKVVLEQLLSQELSEKDKNKLIKVKGLLELFEYNAAKIFLQQNFSDF